MRFKAILKLFATNFRLVWKTAMYELINLLITGSLAVVASLPVISKLKEAGFFEQLTNMLTRRAVGFSGFVDNFEEIFRSFIKIISENWSTLGSNIIVFAILLVILAFFISSLKDIATSEVLYGKMSCNARFGYSNSIIRNFGSSFIYGLIKIFTVLVIDIAILALLVVINLASKQNAFWNFLSPFVLMLVFIVLYSLKMTLFSCWTPTIVVNDKKPLKALLSGIKLSCKNFLGNFSTAIILMITIITANLILATSTVAVSLIVTIPASIVLIAIFNMIVYYTNSGMYFYLGDGNIQDKSKGIKRLEEQDTVKKMKNII